MTTTAAKTAVKIEPNISLDKDDWRDVRIRDAMASVRSGHPSDPYFSLILGRMIHCYTWVKPMPMDVIIHDDDQHISQLTWDEKEYIIPKYTPILFEIDLLKAIRSAELNKEDAEYLIGLPNIIDQREDKNERLIKMYKTMKEQATI